MKNYDDPFPVPVPNLAIVMYVSIMDVNTLTLAEVDICARISLWMSCAL